MTGTSNDNNEITTEEDPPPSDYFEQERNNINRSTLPVPKSNTVYATKDYWEERFATEKDYEWLMSYQQLAAQLTPYLQANTRILMVGCGNSPFSADLYDAGYTNIVNIDYSETVIAAMKARHDIARPKMEWRVMDMTDLSDLSDTSFDVVIDKATMDALLSTEGDVWNPERSCIDQARAMCAHVSRILKLGGHFLQISLAQPHFRKIYLLGWHGNPDADRADASYSAEFEWSCRVDTANKSTQDACFGHFFYVLTKTTRS
jgi:SAM-dependent methyltransferase